MLLIKETGRTFAANHVPESSQTCRNVVSHTSDYLLCYGKNDILNYLLSVVLAGAHK